MTTRPISRRSRWTALALVALVPVLVAALVTSVLGGATQRTDRVPALIVNNDEMVTVTNPDGSTTPLLAGRLVVTALTAPDQQNFDWALANEATAKDALAKGTAYAVLTIPSTFSQSIASLSSGTPVQAELSLVTNDAHSTLAGTLASTIGPSLASELGRTITQQYLSGLYTQLDTSLGSAGNGARKLASGADSLHTGIIRFSSGLASAAAGGASAASGVEAYAAGVSQYASGVDSLANGLSALATQTGPLQNGIQSVCPDPAQTLADCAATQNLTIGQLSSILGGVGALNSGAATLSAQSAALQAGGSQAASGVRSLASGLRDLTAATAQLDSGAGSLASGATALADGLSSRSGSVTSPTQTATVVSEPVTLSSSTTNAVPSIRDLVALIAVPAAIWLGALAISIAFPAFRRRELQSTASSGVLVLRAVGIGSALAVVQAALALVVALVAGVAVGPLSVALAVAAAAAIAFVAVHVALRLLAPRIAGLISMLLLVSQIVLLPGLVPSAMLPEWMQSIAPALPLTWAMTAMQSVAASANVPATVGAIVALLALAAVAVAFATVQLARRRTRDGLGFVVAESA